MARKFRPPTSPPLAFAHLHLKLSRSRSVTVMGKRSDSTFPPFTHLLVAVSPVLLLLATLPASVLASATVIRDGGVPCTMCDSCDNPCQPISPPPPSPPPPVTTACPPPPSPPSGGGIYYYSPPPPYVYSSPPPPYGGSGGSYYYPPPANFYFTAPPPPNPFLPYFPFYYYSPPPNTKNYSGTVALEPLIVSPLLIIFSLFSFLFL